MRRFDPKKWPYNMSYRFNLKKKDYLSWNPGRDRQDLIDSMRIIIAYKKCKYTVRRLKRIILN